MTLEAAREFIDREYASPLRVSAIARMTARSPFQLIRAFRGAYGMTPAQHLRARRMTRARELLTTTPMPVTEVARRVGYRSLGTFSRVFRAATGDSPLAYRHRTRKPVYIPGCFLRMYRVHR